MKRGFTLVEFLIVIGILSLSIGSILLILTTVVKGVNQTNISAEVKQNGQNVLDTLSGLIRNSTDVYQLNGQPIFGQGVDKPIWSESAIWVWTSTGEKLTIACVENIGVTDNGKIVVHSAAASSTVPGGLLADFKPLSNTDIKSGVDIDCGTSAEDDGFVVSNLQSSAKTVLIDFTAKQGVGAPSRVDFNASAQFKTAISLRLRQ